MQMPAAVRLAVSVQERQLAIVNVTLKDSIVALRHWPLALARPGIKSPNRCRH
jgi:hypothetical protein